VLIIDGRLLAQNRCSRLKSRAASHC
jgi:hypothetical protein